MHDLSTPPGGRRTYRQDASFMRNRLCLILWVMVALPMAAGSVHIRAQAASPSLGNPPRASARQADVRTVWDGVYTDAQAARATSAFGQSCSNCHSLTSQGEGPLAGEKFWEGFTQKTVGDLLTYVRTNMPNGRGGSLPASTYNDLVALILKSNGFPAGMVELAPETAASVQIIPKDGPGELPTNTLVRMIGCLARNGNDWVLTNATAPERVERIGVGAEDAGRALGDRTATLRFVLTRLDSFAGQRVSVSGILIGAGGANGINVSTVNRLGDTCP
jgi:mono/diheme cytochrome c family protein